MTDQVLPAASEAVMPSATGRLLTPGFTFRPTDEELVSCYLKAKVQGKPIFLDAIGEVDVYKHDPSDLPEHSRLTNTKHQEWFFFTTLEKHGKRETKEGYWIQKGADKKIKRVGGDNEMIGMVKRLFFNRGCAPNSQRTYWAIREYRLVDDGHGLKTDAYVLCKVSHNNNHSRPPRVNINPPFSEQECGDDDEKKIQQESNSRSKNFFDLNELPREFEMYDNPKIVDQDNNNNACIPHSALDKELFIRYRRKRKINSSGSYGNNSSQTISSVAAAMVGESETEPVDTTMVPTTSSYTELIKDLQKEMAMERERYKLEINALRTEIEELKMNNSNK